MKLLYTLLLSLLCTLGFSQILEPVKWEMTSKVVSADEYDLVFTARMDDGWSIYSQHTDDAGPVPTSFSFDESDHYSKVGAVAEKGKKKEGPDPLFDNVVVIKFPKGPVVFTQRVKVTDNSKPIVGWLEFMTCDDERCLPPTEVDFSFDLSQAVAPVEETEEAPKSDDGGRAAVEEKEAASETATMTEEVVEATNGRAGAPISTVSAAEAVVESGNILQPVRWEVKVDQYSDNDYDLQFIANLKEGWNLYSQDNGEDGPIPTTFYVKEGDNEVAKALTETGDLSEGMDPIFGVVVKKYKHGPITFSADSDGSQPFEGIIEYMSCDDSRCVNFETPFKVSFNPMAITVGEEGEVVTTPADVEREEVMGPIIEGPGYGNEGFRTNIANRTPLGVCGAEVEEEEGKSLWNIFGLGFLGGLLALITPCVFPMIPLTVSFFTKGSENRRKGIRDAVLYGAFIFGVYLLLSIPFHLMDSLDPDILNKISTNVTLNVVFFLVFIFFAISFFGYFELTVPQSWTNKASSAEGAGGIIGIFFMALTLALVSFSCTGPILGTLLVGALSGDGGAMQLTSGMGGFGLALALPFALFASFPGMMKSLPKSGGWLNSVKVVLGFVELALALKFLSNADLVDHWDFLKIELFLGLWILIGIGLALYLFGKIKFPHDSPIKKLSPVRIGLGVLTVAFVAYLAMGFRVNESGTYRPLSLLSGIAPSVCYSYLKPCHCPQELECFKDLEEGLAYAKKVNKPVMLDFTGYACVNCRRMEENVWNQPEILPMLKEDYIVISLYVDDKKELADPITVTKASDRERELDEVGELWSHFQEIVFEQNTQPQYALISPDGKRLNPPVSYTPDVNEYAEFLKCGLSNYENLND